MSIFKSINNQFEHVEVEENKLASFYTMISKILFRVTAYFITPVMVIGSYYFFINLSHVYAYVELFVATLLVIIVYINLFTIVQKRVIILVIYYIASVALLLTTGPTGAGLVSIMTSIMFIALLTRKTRNLQYLYVFTFVLFILLTIGIHSGLLEGLLISEYRPTWVIVMIVMLVFSLGIISAIEFYKDSMMELYIETSNNYSFLQGAINSISSVIFALDNDGNITFYNQRIKAFSGIEELSGRNYEEVFNVFTELQTTMIESKDGFDHISKDFLASGDFYYEIYGVTQYVNRSVYDMKDQMGKVVLITDITDRVAREKKLEYLATHDQLTDLLNRKRFDTVISQYEKERVFPLAFAIVDINGLALINESFGHKVGDRFLQKTAEVIKSCTEESVFRIGGDEFAILFPNKSITQAETFISCLEEKISEVNINNFEVSLSAGAAERNTASENLTRVLKRSEGALSTAKLSQSNSMRSKTISLILDTLYEKNQREMAHSKRVSKIAKYLAEALELDSSIVLRLELSGLMHDIGKIGIEEQILNKKERLNNDEWSKIQQHPEIGYRILSTHDEFADIAEYVLQHHENYDGTGYPSKLVGEDILLGARILSVADSYDAMTGPRTYRDSLTKSEAIEELLKGAGSQFDSNLVKVFIEKVVETL